MQELIEKTREDIQRLEYDLQEEIDKVDQIHGYWRLSDYGRKQLRRRQEEIQTAIREKQRELKSYLSKLAREQQREPLVNYEMREGPISNVDDLIDHVFEESSSVLSSRFEHSRPFSVIYSSLTCSPSLDSRFDVSRSLTVTHSPQASLAREMAKEKAVKPLKRFEMTGKKDVGPVKHFGTAKDKNIKPLKRFEMTEGKDVEESAEEPEKPSLKPIHRPMDLEEYFDRERLKEHLDRERLEKFLEQERLKNRGEQHRRRAEEQIIVAKRHQPEFHSVDELVEWALVDQEKEEEQLNPEDHQRAQGRLRVPYDNEVLLDEIMMVVPNSLLEFAGAGYYQKPHVHNLLWQRTAYELRAIHRTLFKHHPPHLPVEYASEEFIRKERILQANTSLLEAGFDYSDSDRSMDKKEEMRQKVSKSRLKQTQPNRSTPERQALTDAQRQAKRRAKQRKMTTVEWEKLKKERALEKKEARKQKKRDHRRDQRKNRTPDDSSSSQEEQ